MPNDPISLELESLKNKESKISKMSLEQLNDFIAAIGRLESKLSGHFKITKGFGDAAVTSPAKSDKAESFTELCRLKRLTRNA